ncbi:MAG: hypothetical protein JW751_00170 [Polyangiaceae bacterium]|nr:hypothetical protein [Polyangiaceae bacterium]
MTRAKTDKGGARTAGIRAGEPGRATVAEAASERSFSSLLERMIEVSGEARLARPPAARGSDASGGVAEPEEGTDTASPTALTRAIDGLDPDSALGLCAVARAGRDAQDIAAARAAMLADRVGADSARRTLRQQGSMLGDLLQRGQAIAYATGFDLEAPFSSWPADAEEGLEARAWLRFGRQLAQSQPKDWQCFAIVEARRIAKLYLRVSDNQWWSFRRLLDRPTTSIVDRERKRGRPNSVRSGTLEAMAGQSGVAGSQALRRALSAIRARVGVARGGVLEGSRGSESARNHG